MMKRAVFALGAVVWAMSLSACSPECRVDNECGSGTCVEGACVPDDRPMTCTSGRVQCASDEVCDTDGECKTCTATQGCSAPQFCDTSADNGAGQCVNCVADGNQGCGDSTPVCDATANGGAGACVTCTAEIGCTGSTVCDVEADQGAGACVGCRDDNDCSGGTPFCDSETNVCKACVTDANCSGSTPVCDPSGVGACRTCTATAGCSGATPSCDVSANNGNGACVECVSNGNCTTAGQTVCNTDNNTCVTCTASAGCSGATAACDTDANGGEGACVECVDNSTCGGATPQCDTTTNSCVTCLADNTGCSGATPLCNVTANGGAGECVECLNDGQCTVGAANQCDPSSNQCVVCYLDGTTSEGCSGDDVCDVSVAGGRCLGCVTNDDCAEPTEACLLPPGACVECTDDTHCEDTTRPSCGAVAANTCGCSTHQQCSDANSATPACDFAAGGGNGLCTVCTAEYCSGFNDTPTCSEGVGCICANNGDCDSNEECTGSPAACTVFATPAATTSQQLQDFLDLADGAIAAGHAVDGALVSYLKPATGADAAGFFLQAEANGPAVFVQVNPATTTPALNKGDRINLKLTNKVTTNGVETATAISDLAVVSTSPHPVDQLPPRGLVTDLSTATDITTNLDAYTADLVRVTGTIATAFASAGSGHSAAQITTAGYPSPNTDLRVRFPTTLVTAMELGVGCTVTVTGPMWRFTTTAQISAYNASEVTDVTCPAPRVLIGEFTSATTMELKFDRSMDPASLTGATFSVTNGATATNPTLVDPFTLTVEISTLTTGTQYVLTVAGLTDTYGTALNPDADTVSFYGPGSTSPAAGSVVINELDYDMTGTDLTEFVELYNTTASPITIHDLHVVLVSGGGTLGEYDRFSLTSARDHQGNPTNVLPAGGYVLAASPDFIDAIQPKTAGVLYVKFLNNFGGGQDNLIQNGGVDALGVLHNPSGTLLDALSYEGDAGSHAIATGASVDPITFDFAEGTGTSLADTAASSLSRSSTGADTNNNQADFTLQLPTPGAVNP